VGSLDLSLFGDEKNELVIQRAALFLRLKDVYLTADRSTQRIIDSFVGQLSRFSETEIKTLPKMIDYIVGGKDGHGACLQDATERLFELHNKIREDFDIAKIQDDINIYIEMGKWPVTKNNAAENSNQPREKKSTVDFFSNSKRQEKPKDIGDMSSFKMK